MKKKKEEERFLLDEADVTIHYPPPKQAVAKSAAPVTPALFGRVQIQNKAG